MTGFLIFFFLFLGRASFVTVFKAIIYLFIVLLAIRRFRYFVWRFSNIVIIRFIIRINIKYGRGLWCRLLPQLGL